MGITVENDLTPKQQLFIDAYISNGMNGCDAARQAGYKGNSVTIKAVAAENLAKPHLKSIIEQEQAKLREQFAERRQGLLADVDEVKAEIEQVKAEFPDNPNVRVNLISKRLDAIDKEAKLTGAYTKEQENPQTTAEVIRRASDAVLQHYIDAGMPRGEAEALVASVAGVVSVEQVQ